MFGSPRIAIFSTHTQRNWSEAANPNINKSKTKPTNREAIEEPSLRRWREPPWHGMPQRPCWHYSCSTARRHRHCWRPRRGRSSRGLPHYRRPRRSGDWPRVGCLGVLCKKWGSPISVEQRRSAMASWHAHWASGWSAAATRMAVSMPWKMLAQSGSTVSSPRKLKYASNVEFMSNNFFVHLADKSIESTVGQFVVREKYY